MAAILPPSPPSSLLQEVHLIVLMIFWKLPVQRRKVFRLPAALTIRLRRLAPRHLHRATSAELGMRMPAWKTSLNTSARWSCRWLGLASTDLHAVWRRHMEHIAATEIGPEIRRR